jgi:hypothetical protein
MVQEIVTMYFNWQLRCSLENEVAYITCDYKETGNRSFEYHHGSLISSSLIVSGAELLLTYMPEGEYI